MNRILPRYLTLVVCAAGLLFGIAGRASADEAYGGCDIRLLNLSPAQKAQMRFIRMQNKRKPVRKADSDVLKSRLAALLAREDFDSAEAKRIVVFRYEGKMNNDLNELQTQHDIFRVLNREQQTKWLNSCLFR